MGKLIENAGLETDRAWVLAAVAVGIITSVTIFISWRMMRGVEPVGEPDESQKRSFGEVLKELKRLLTLKPYVLIIISALLTNVFFTLFYSDMLYFTTFSMGISEAQASILYTIMTVCSIIFVSNYTISLIFSLFLF